MAFSGVAHTVATCDRYELFTRMLRSSIDGPARLAMAVVFSTTSDSGASNKRSLVR